MNELLSSHDAFARLRAEVPLEQFGGSTRLWVDPPVTERMLPSVVSLRSTAILLWIPDPSVAPEDVERIFDAATDDLVASVSRDEPIVLAPFPNGPVGKCTHVGVLHSWAHPSQLGSAGWSVRYLYRLLPCYPIEFAKNDGCDFVGHRHGTLRVGNPDRDPSPAVTLTYDLPKVRRGTARMHVSTYPKFLEVLAMLREHEGWCDFENHESKRALLRYENSAWELVIRKKARSIADELVDAWAHAYFFEGAGAAQKVLEAGG